MDGLGALNFNDYRVGVDAVTRNSGAGAPDFADMLRRVAASQNTASQQSESEPRSPVPGPQSPSTDLRSPFAKIDKTDKLYEQCVELEIFLVKSLISSMRSTVQKSSLVEEGFAGKMYEDMLYEEYAKDYTKNANFGLAEQAYRQLKSL